MPTCTAAFKYIGPGGVSAFNIVSFVSPMEAVDQDAVDTIAANWSTAWRTQASGGWNMQANTRFVFPAINPTDELSANADGGIGLYAVAADPVQNAVVLSYNAGVGRRKHGRAYLVGVHHETCIEGSLIQDTIRTGYLSDFQTFVTTTAADTGFVLGVRSLADGVVRPIGAIHVDPYVMTQRRRVERLAFP